MSTRTVELSLNEMERITGAMTKEEREAAVKADDDDSFIESVDKSVLRPVVYGLDAIGDMLEPLNEKLDPVSPQRVRSTTKAAVQVAWDLFTGLF